MAHVDLLPRLAATGFSLRCIVAMAFVWAALWPEAAFAAGPSAKDLAALAEHPYYGYNVIVLIDKGKEGTGLNAQHMRYFVYNPKRKKLTFKGRWYVSTGAQIPATNKLGRVSPRKTLTGYFDVDELKPDYYSNSWDGPMLFSVFFDFPRYAIHATEPYNYAKLGRRASGGCVRLRLENAIKFFDLVEDEGKGWTYKLNSKTGKPLHDKKGKPVVKWGYKSLVVVAENGRLVPTHFGFRDEDEVYATPESAYDYINFPSAHWVLRNLSFLN